MATLTATQPNLPAGPVDKKPTAAAASGKEFWAKHTRSIIEPLLSSAGTYAEADQASHLRFLEEHVAPCLGSQPAEPPVEYYASPALAGTRFEVSLNLSTNGKVKVRYNFDFMRDGTGPDPFGLNNARETLHRLCAASNGDSRLMDHLMDAFHLTQAETEAWRDKVPPQMHIPPAIVAFELEGPKHIMKAYVPVLRSVVSERSAVDITLDALRGLEPLGYDLSYSLDALSGYLAGAQGKVRPLMVGIDCLDPKTHPNSRVKVYFHTESNTFEAAREVITLGGRLTDEYTLKKVDLLRSIWPLLLNEKNGIPEGNDVETWSKPERAPGTPLSGLMFSFDLAAGNTMPDVKTYVPVFQYAERSDIVGKNMDAILEKLGHEWGRTGKFSEVTNAVFEKQKGYGQSLINYSYNKSKGAYLTAYFGLPIFNGEGVAGHQAGGNAYNILE